MDYLFHDYFLLFTIIALGYLLGRVKIFNFSLDISAVLFVAMVFGYYGYKLPSIVQNIGLLFFIYTVGIQAGPGFFDSFRTNGRSYAFLAFLIVLVSTALVWIITLIFNYDINLMVGLLTGALTSTPGLATVINETNSPLASVGYSIAYPFGVIGVILFIRTCPYLFRVDLAQEEQRYKHSQREEYPQIFHRHFVVQNPGVIGKSLRELSVRSITGAVISRVRHGNESSTALPETLLQLGDVIRAVGTEKSLKKVEKLIGPETCEEILLSEEYDVQPVLVTNKHVHNKTLGELRMFTDMHATITRVRRSGIDISPTPNFRVKLGDKLIVAARKDDMNGIFRLFGNDDQKLSDTDIMPIALGIISGTLVGNISLVFGDYSFSLGLAGGVLLVGLLLGKTGRTGPLIWTLSAPANQLLRQLGLALFLVPIGLNAGQSFVDVLHNYGIPLLISGALVTLLPMIIVFMFARYRYKTNFFELLGIIAGGMTSTPGLAASETYSNSNAAAVAYATIYPMAMVLVILAVKVLITMV